MIKKFEVKVAELKVLYNSYGDQYKNYMYGDCDKKEAYKKAYEYKDEYDKLFNIYSKEEGFDKLWDAVYPTVEKIDNWIND